MFIQTEQTPNPATLKFIPGKEVMAQGSVDFPDAEAAEGVSPLAEKLFSISGVRAVFFGHDFITLTKGDDVEWYELKPAVLGAVMEHFTAGHGLLYDTAKAEAGAVASGHADEGESFDEADKEIVGQIKELLDTRVRPAVAQDGGDIVFHGFQQGVVYLTMQGACAGCPSSTATLKMGIENMLRHYIPEVTEVRAAL